MATNDGASYFVGPDDDPDKYRLLQQVGRGGEADLWQAELSVDGGAEPVAIKMQHDDRRDPTSARRWGEQAELLRFVAHPGVIGVREYFEGARLHPRGGAPTTAERVLFLVMNWVDGMPLDEWAMVNRDAPDRLSRVLRHLAQAADVLDWLHSGQATPSRRPVIHGDLSPGNVMITSTGQAMLVDFGLVRLVSHQTSRAAGTPGYAAPEVWQAGRYSPASDRFSFGAIGYFALTGQAPPPDPRALRAGLAGLPMLATADPGRIDRLMAIFNPRPDDRPASAVAWVRELRETALTSTHPPSSAGGVSTYVPPPGPVTPPRTDPARDGGGQAVQPPPAPRSRFRRTKLTAALVVLLLVLGGGIYLGNQFGGGSGAAAAPTSTAPPAPVPTAAGPSSTVSTGPPTIDPAQARIRRQTGTAPIRLTGSYGVDIDSLEPAWGVTNSDRGDNDVYLSSSGSALLTENSTDLAPVPGATPDFAVCQSATSYFSRVDLTNLQPRTSYCLRTSQGRYAMITLENSEEPLVIDVTVWDPPRSS